VKRKSNTITKKEDIDYFISLDIRTLTSLSFIMETFGEFGDKRRFNPYDIITIPADSYGPEGKRNKKPFTTSVGIFVFNKTFIEPELFDLFGYIDTTLTKSVAKMINSKIGYAVLEDKIPLEAMKNYIMRTQKFQPYSNILCPSFTMNMLLITDKIEKRKNALLTKHKDSIDNGDEKVVAAIEKELLDYCKEVLDDDPSMDLYKSGAKGSFGNNFKNLFVMRGAIKDPDPTKGYDIVTSNYIDGVTKKDYPKTAKSLAAGPYSRAKKTQFGGYWEKLFLKAFQHITLLPAGSDCGTTSTIKINISSKNASMIMYNYIVENNKLIELTSDNISQYMGKTVNMRFSSLCKEKKGFCNKCSGNLFYRLGILNVGVATPQLASRLKVIALKAFHDSQIQLHDIDVAKAFGM
jgi:hypothetical protein